MMTCIAAVTDGKRVWMGGDSAGFAGTSLTVRADEKVFRNGPFLIGASGSFRMSNLVRYALDVPQMDPAADADRWMVTIFVDALRKTLDRGGHSSKEHNSESIDGQFLVGYRGQLYIVESDYQVGRFRDPFGAIGCAADVALGALYVTRRQRGSQKARLRHALEASERFSSGVRGPFVIKTMA
jgi:hypothetical protein